MKKETSFRLGSLASARTKQTNASSKVDSDEENKRRARSLRFSNGRSSSRSQTKAAQVQDPHSYGFVSRGEDIRLQKSEQAQREYFEWILETFKQHETPENSALSGKDEASKPDSKSSLHEILANLRKLREALLHKEADEFSKQVHLFSVRVSSAVGNYQTYVPCINYLLENALDLLTEQEKREIAALWVLHISHQNGDNPTAMKLFFEYLDPKVDSRILDTMMAWVQGDYYAWLQLYNTETDHSLFAIMSAGLSHMLQHLVACFDKAYFTHNLDDFRRYLPKGMEFEEFAMKFGVKWEIEENVIHIRRRQAKPSNPTQQAIKEGA